MLLTIPQAAELLACSTRQVRRLMDGGQLAYVRLGKTGRSDRIVEAELMRFVEDNQCHSTKSMSGTVDFKPKAKSIDDLLGQARAGKPRNLSDDTEEKLSGGGSSGRTYEQALIKWAQGEMPASCAQPLTTLGNFVITPLRRSSSPLTPCATECWPRAIHRQLATAAFL